MSEDVELVQGQGHDIRACILALTHRCSYEANCGHHRLSKGIQSRAAVIIRQRNRRGIAYGLLIREETTSTRCKSTGRGRWDRVYQTRGRIRAGLLAQDDEAPDEPLVAQRDVHGRGRGNHR